ncbi:DNA polymerase III subunit beta [Virgibacillus halodenitrificans]|jgi:DNA polymerase III subunit beta|uniref:Beta sliding clamp n=1 Tax=Virgibacillus halodenitrificans TaxID=1482 RepID=A0AAC9NIU7_VIRHA|nr:DNA polymerase III subunit beta [Virgibacillus halodenitrificans]APC46688.1 DNA polymerase III subunit beta [Virgibacillus halodenitrificans]MBD1222302.1 DNA polymerase III subunit beta [Virgibacillus halodenitrificans]MCG1027550.1 DNA polymerase III subunit beta [Virgibacillus halodenitrificans]MCJ0931581.1 DNA polymerase III subunit beta [Virgibacillus halodenitrificans]MEC2157596.1 DNA polymerase III subunit beta [Virgibacillus halodenitrificans]
MKFIIQRDQLIASIQDVMKAISSRTVVPILTGMKIEVKQHGITLTGSDSDISIESYIPAEEDGNVNVEQIEEGSIVLQAKYFPDIVRKLPEKTVEIEADENLKVTIRSGKAEFNLNGQDAEEYPQLPKLQTDDSFELPTDLLKSLIKQTVFAVSTMETRPILTGVHIKLEEGNLTFTATDSHRLASREVPVSDSNTAFPSVVVPGKSLNELNKILDDTEEPVEISVTNNQILFRAKNLNFLSRLLDGNYPETSRLIPEQSKTVLYAKTKELLNTIDRASLLAKEERNNVVRLNTQGDNVINITGNSPEVGTVSEEIVVQSMEGEELKISFSSKYMIDALKAIEYEEVKVEFTGAMRPFIIRPANEDPILQLILPVRTF